MENKVIAKEYVDKNYVFANKEKHKKVNKFEKFSQKGAKNEF